MSVVFAFPLALSLLLQGGSCNRKSAQGNSPSVKQDTGSTNRNSGRVESSPSNRNDAVESGSVNGNRGKDEPGMEQSDKDEKAGKQERKSVEAGTWGGAHIRLQVNASGAEVEYDCGHGTLEQMTLEGDGQFDVRGTHAPERGGPIRLGKEPRSLPARYTGQVKGQTMTLRVTLTGTGEEIGAFKLTRGATARLLKCL